MPHLNTGPLSDRYIGEKAHGMLVPQNAMYLDTLETHPIPSMHHASSGADNLYCLGTPMTNGLQP